MPLTTVPAPPALTEAARAAAMARVEAAFAPLLERARQLAAEQAAWPPEKKAQIAALIAADQACEDETCEDCGAHDEECVCHFLENESDARRHGA